MVEVLWERHIGSVMFYLLDMAHERRQACLPWLSRKNSDLSVRKTTLVTVKYKYIALACLDEKADPLHFWQQHCTNFPQLAQLAQQYLATPASSSPVERIFSVAGKVFRPERCCLSDTRFEEQMFLRCNNKPI